MLTRGLCLPFLVIACSLQSIGVLGLASCCVNSTSGVDFDDCVCLVDNTQLSGQSLAAGETRLYHWVLSMNNSELVSASIRGNLTFEVCIICATKLFNKYRSALNCERLSGHWRFVKELTENGTARSSRVLLHMGRLSCEGSGVVSVSGGG